MLVNFSAGEAKGLFIVRLAYFLFLIAVFLLCSRFRLERILAPISGGTALIIFIYGIVQKFVIFPLILENYRAGPSFYSQALLARASSGRVFSIFPLPTLYAMVCGLLLIFIIHYLHHARGPARIFWGMLLLLGAANLVLTESFGGILFFTAATLFYLFVSRTFRIRHLAPLLMILSLVFFLVLALRFSEARDLTPAKLRFANWQQAGRVISESPVLGVGLGNYETAVPPHVKPDEPVSIYAHNFFLQMAAETGLPLFLFLAVIGLAWLKARLPMFLKPENALFASACVLILLFNMFDIGNYFFAAGISFAVVFSQVARSERPEPARQIVAVALLAAVLLFHHVAVSRQQAGDLWLSRQEPARAKALYRSALKLNPFSYRSWLGLAHIALQEKDPAGTDLALKKVLEIFPGQPYANYLFSVSSWRRGAYGTALAASARAAKGNLKNKEYQRWHEFVQDNLSRQPAIPGN